MEGDTALGLLTIVELLISLLLACVAGVLIFLKIPGLEQVTRYSYSVFDMAIALVIFGAIVSVLRWAGRLATHRYSAVASDVPEREL